MQQVWRDQEDLALVDGDIHRLPVLHGLQQHVAFDLVEEFLARVVVEVLAGVGTAHHLHHETRVGVDALVAHRWLQEVAVLVDPLLEVYGTQAPHGAILRGWRCTSIRWRWAWARPSPAPWCGRAGCP